MITIKVNCTNGFKKVQKQYQISQVWGNLSQQVHDLIAMGTEYLVPISGEVIYPWGLVEELYF